MSLHANSILLKQLNSVQVCGTSAKEEICNHRCLSVCLSVSNLRKNFRTDLHEIFMEGWQWAIEQMIKFWWRSGSRIWIRIRIRIATLVRRVLAEVCTVPVLLVAKCLVFRGFTFFWTRSFILFAMIPRIIQLTPHSMRSVHQPSTTIK